MWSDNYDDDWFDSNSNQDHSVIDQQVYLFEMRRSMKRDKYWKRKRNEKLCPISTRKLQSQAVLLKFSCKRYEEKPKIEQKSFGYRKYVSLSTGFDCDEEVLTEPTETEPTKRSKPSKKSTDTDLTDFAHFRNQFYQKNHKNIKSSLSCRQNGDCVVNIRMAPVNESVQIDFIRNFNENSHIAPQLVYHGTRSNRIGSILRYGFLVPNESHPTNKNAPIIQSVNGQAYGPGIYCSRTASYSSGYARDSGTLLVCAALPNYDQKEKVEYFSGNILVLPRVSQIIPLFLMDFNSSSMSSHCNNRWYPPGTQFEREKIPKEKEPMMLPKQILRKILKYVNDRTRKNQRYQIRLCN